MSTPFNVAVTRIICTITRTIILSIKEIICVIILVLVLMQRKSIAILASFASFTSSLALSAVILRSSIFFAATIDASINSCAAVVFATVPFVFAFLSAAVAFFSAIVAVFFAAFSAFRMTDLARRWQGIPRFKL